MAVRRVLAIAGPLPDPVVAAIHEEDLVAASVLSGNRNLKVGCIRM